ncbi:type I 3-dehydroquinate dehydratase [Cellulomonas sp. C5510]|uniref:type I 3-dehydroquinate dehydratase n=1 Tax=Cellulomonas sp. C5510 TaxID=2871170 RepID=UPI001C966397|nr:type I 3-dehydroquinate dehydratase [Cellulomonas sp. C5510]QZN85004.1 type I 3-dehydroquinate dehydratase [Cellulomonas sp. C5510]
MTTTPGAAPSGGPSAGADGPAERPALPARRPVTVRGTTLGGPRPAVVVPVTATEPDTLRAEAAAAAAARPDVVEWRADHLAAGVADPTAVARAALVVRDAVGDLPLLVTVRTTAEGGHADVEGDAYAAPLLAVLATGAADLLDVEVARDPATVRRLLDAAHAAGVPVVGSSHDFAGTPSRDALVGRLLAMADLGADVLKVAVTPHDPDDVLTLLAATLDASRRTDRPLVTMAMGPLGVVSRVGGGVFGSAATFGTVGAASAPGQVRLGALRAALDVVHGPA